MSRTIRIKRAAVAVLGVVLLGCESGAMQANGIGSAGAAAPLPESESLTESSRFSFFVTSLASMRALSGSPAGFGGDLRFGQASGLEGADEICRQVAERSLPGSGQKGWRAFLSATRGADGEPVHARERIGDGPWYDRLGRLVAANKDDLLQPRPRGADPVIMYDLPTEDGVPHHMDGAVGCSGSSCPDNHQVLTGSNEVGMLHSADPAYTCSDWTSSARSGSPMCGHSWPRQDSGINWMSATPDGGCAPCVSLDDDGGVRSRCVGSAGGYGAIYCFALTP